MIWRRAHRRRMDPEPSSVGSRVWIEQPKLRPAVWTIVSWEQEACFAWVASVQIVAMSAAPPDDRKLSGAALIRCMREASTCHTLAREATSS